MHVPILRDDLFADNRSDSRRPSMEMAGHSFCRRVEAGGWVTYQWEWTARSVQFVPGLHLFLIFSKKYFCHFLYKISIFFLKSTFFRSTNSQSDTAVN